MLENKKSGNISETRKVKIEEKLLWRAYRKSSTLFRTVPSPTPYGLPPRLGIGGSQPHPKTAITIISGTVKLFSSLSSSWCQRRISTVPHGY